MIETLAAYIPRDRAAQIFAGAPLAGEGLALIADISGFTPLTETLARVLSPARGAEELTAALNGVFAPLIDAAHAYGGSVVKFGGDALIVWFPRPPGRRREAVLRGALAAAYAMQAAVAAHGALETSAGRFTLTMKVGAAYGPVVRVRLGEAAYGYEDVIGGATLDRMAEAEHRAGPGEVLIDPAGLPELVRVAPLLGERDGFVVVGPPLRAPRRAPPPPPPAGASAAVLRPYVPAEVAEALAAGRAQPAELKPVVSIFVQFAGVQYEDAAAAEAQLAAYFGAAQRAAARYGGRVNRLITGDKGSVLHLIFGAPRALEELEARAARCALELRQAAAALPFISAQRVGMAAGRAFAGPVGAPARHDYTVMGDAINLSARLMQRAAPGQIVLAPALAARLGPGFALAPLGPAALKGKAAPVELFALEGEAAAGGAAPPLGRVFGRDAELAALAALAAELGAGRGAAAVLIGELGTGKSHLLAALRYQVAGPAGAGRPRWVTASAPAYGGRPGGALIAALLGGLLGLGERAGYADLEAACARLLGPRRGGAAAPYLARLLGLSLDARREADMAALSGESLRWRLRELAGELALAAAAGGPLVLALDDLQWADATSLDLLAALVPVAATAPLLLILAARPEPQSRAWPLLARLRGAGAPWLELGPLDEAGAAELLRHHAPGLPAAALARLAERGGGNPLFLVELARAAAAAGPEAELPDSVQGLLLAQIDRLPAALRATLQRAALLGRSPNARLLAELDGAGGLESRLAALAGAGLLVGEGGGYSFRHILVQESAYAALLYERRRAGHARAAAALERLYPTQVAERSAELAGHYERAGEMLAAARYHGQAADAARLLYANEEAEAGYRHVLDLLGPAGDEALRGRTLLKLAQVRMNAGDYAAAQELYDLAFAAIERAEAAEGPRRRRRVPVFRMGALEPETLDPGLVAASAGHWVAVNLFEGLVELDDELSVVPAAARRWRVEDDGRRYIFELRAGLRWSDGAPLTAHDFVAAWRRNLHPDTGAELADRLHLLRGAERYAADPAAQAGALGVSAPDERTLVVELDAPAGYFMALLATPIAFPQPAHALARHGAGWSEPRLLICNGPYLLRRWRPGRELELRKNPHYRSPAAVELERALLRFLTAGDDWARRQTLDFVRLADRSSAGGDEPGALITLNFPVTFFLSFACAHPPVDDPALRRALAACVDRERLVREVWGGVQLPGNGGIVPPGLPGHSPELAPPFDPAAARALLAGLPRPPGRLVLAVPIGFGATPYLLQRDWREQLGLEVEVVADLPDDELIAGLGSGAFQIALYGWEAEYPDPDNMLRSLFASASPANCFGWSNPRFDRLVSRAAGSVEASERMALYHQAERLLVVQEAAAIPLYYERAYGLLRRPFELRDGARLSRSGQFVLSRVRLS